LPQGRARSVFLLHGALARCRRRAWRHDHRYLLRGYPDPDREVPGSRQGQSGSARHHSHERSLATARDGDLRAQVTAVKTGERRFLELLDRYGQQAVMNSIAEIMDRAEAAARARTLTIPDGVYEAESWLDDDGVDIGKRIPIKVKVTVKGDEMTIDLTDVSKQVRGFFNSAITTGYGCAQVAYKCITSPTDYPINDGAFRGLKVVIPPGRIVSATRPAPMRLW